MKDFFDEDFPLSKKQEEELLKLAEAPTTLEEPPVLDEEPNEEPCFEPIIDVQVIVPEENEIMPEENETAPEADEIIPEDADESLHSFDDEPIDEAFSYTPEEEAVKEETAEEDAPETLAFDFFDEPLEEAEEEALKEAVEEKVPAVSHDEYLARLRQMNEIEEQLSREIKSLGEQIDSVEQKVDNLPDEPMTEDEDESEDFSYEYDERYFAEEETPAFKHPELYKKSAHSKPVPKKTKAKDDELTVNVKTLLKVGAAVAATVAAVKLLSDKDKK